MAIEHLEPDHQSNDDEHVLSSAEPAFDSHAANPPETTPQLRIVGIGASAGGLDSLERLFTHLPADTGMAFIVLQHLAPDFKSLMDELL